MTSNECVSFLRTRLAHDLDRSASGEAVRMAAQLGPAGFALLGAHRRTRPRSRPAVAD